MKKGLAILLILSSFLNAVKQDDAVGIATYDDLSLDFARLFKEDSKSPVTRVKSQSSLEKEDIEIPLPEAARRRQSIERIRQLSHERIATNARTKSAEEILTRQNQQAADAQQQQQQQEDNQ